MYINMIVALVALVLFFIMEIKPSLLIGKWERKINNQFGLKPYNKFQILIQNIKEGIKDRIHYILKRPPLWQDAMYCGDKYCRYCGGKKYKQLTIKDCICTVRKGYFMRCKFHQECIGVPCASGINICDNPKHQENE